MAEMDVNEVELMWKVSKELGMEFINSKDDVNIISSLEREDHDSKG